MRYNGEEISIALPDGVTLNLRRARNELRARRVELVVRCQELARFLRGLDEVEWAGWLEARVTDISAARANGVQSLLDGSAGMGGIGDMYLCPEAGHRLAPGDEHGINDQFLLMLAKVNHLAREVRALSSPMR